MSARKPPYRLPELQVFQKAYKAARGLGLTVRQSTEAGHRAVSGSGSEGVHATKHTYVHYTSLDNDW